jgi:transcriptional regulator with XRE-family HTH domain
MSGHRPWSEIKRRRTPEDQARIDAGVREMLVIADLTALREARALTQSALAAEVGVSQARISQIENQGDLTLSTLDEYVRGLGGELRLSVVFPDQTVELARVGGGARS